MPNDDTSHQVSDTNVCIRALTPRNPFANHPLMSKGGKHEKSKSAQRAAARRETKKLARDWA